MKKGITTKRIPVSPEEAANALREMPQWIVEKSRIYRDFRFENFKKALAFVNRVAKVAETVRHHPNILIHEYSFVRIEIYDHLLAGLSNYDILLIKAIERGLGK
ncbi:MAG: 4a-hydroxytetrahydrobiopterin dehydratase [Candidatus Sungbacteria bacterium]|uniref:4a-hydroxytetrahydrobiopterin dehydratase n=1 Tax=Candidatus Sungiibacteriota bacterium TaxID=2750080 RepID=A0A931SC15_9BACT|nr:4a-hydroxytetrahydrobiopterin dehydratase [Candidatus Sungbacteria bacterium]